MTSASSGLFLGGSRDSSSEDVRSANVRAAIAVANLVKSSLGPVGLDKMLVDDIGDVTITNDGATILNQLQVEHPAARLLVDLAQLQDKEVGDGTTSVVLLAAELLRRANVLTSKALHPTAVIAGYRVALKAAVAHLKKEMVISLTQITDEHLINAAKTSMSSKIIGKTADFFADLAVKAVKSVKNETTNKYPISALHILKAHGQSAVDSQFIPNGFALATSKAAQGMPNEIVGEDIKIALLDFNLQRHRMGLGVNIQVKDPKELKKIQQHELDITAAKIQTILKAGAKIVLTTKGIDDVCLKYFVEAGVMACRRVNKDDLRRLAKATGGHVVTTLADMEGEESFDADALGTCGGLRQIRLGESELWQFDQCQGSGAGTIVLRGANEYMLDEMDRALHDSLCVVKRMLESNTLVPGGGAVEAELSVHLEEFALTRPKEQIAIQEFAEAMLVIPKTLAVNAALDATELVAQLRSKHAEGDKTSGLDLQGDCIRDNLAAGVVEPAMSKIKSLRFATEAAITILRIDDRITVVKNQ